MKICATCSVFAFVFTVAAIIWVSQSDRNTSTSCLTVSLIVGALSIASAWSYLRTSRSPRRPRFLLCLTVMSVIATLFWLMQWVSFYE